MTRLRSALALGAVLGGWAALTETGLVRHRAVAGPIATARATYEGVASGALLADLGATAARVAVGVSLGLAAGLLLGVVAGRRTRALEPALDFLRAIPPLLVFPFLLLAFGYGETARVGVIAWACALVVSLHVAGALAAGSPERLRAIRAMGASRWQTLRWLHAYEVLPACATGLRHAVATGIVVAVVTEMVVGAPHGLGARAVAAQVAYETPQLFAVVLSTGAVGYATSQALLALERRFDWRE